MSPPKRRRGAAMRVILPQPHMVFRFTKPQEFDHLDDDDVCDSDDPALSEESDACSETSTPNKKQKPSKENGTQSHDVPKEQGDSSKSSSGTARMSYFGCNLCFKSERQPVVTACGHLFCYSCLCDRLQIDRKCPVCEAEVVDGRIFPIYQCSGPRLKNVEKSV